MGPARTALAGALAGLLLMAGCGTRAPADQIVAGAGGGSVRLSPATVQELEEPAAPAAGGPARPSVQAAAATAPRITQVPAAMAATSGPAHPSARRSAVALPARVTSTIVPGQSAACSRPGEPVAIGQVGTFSGVVAPISVPARTTLAAWAAYMNSSGGLACHPVTVYSEDDSGDPARAAYLVGDLVSRHHVVAFVANVVPLSIAGFRPAVEAAHVPVVGGLGGGKAAFESSSFFPDGPSFTDLVAGLVGAGVQIGRQKLGLLYCVETTTCTDLDEAVRKGGAQSAGAKIVYDSAVSVTQPDFTAQCLNARDAGADMLALAVDGASITRVARSCQAVGYRPTLLGVAGALTPSQASDPTLRALGLATVSAEAPWMLTDTPGLAEYHSALSRWAPALESDGAAVNAWASAELLRTAVGSAAPAPDRPLTTATVLTGLGRIHGTTLGGLTPPIDFTSEQARSAGTGCLFDEVLTSSGWSAPHGSKPRCLRRR